MDKTREEQLEAQLAYARTGRRKFADENAALRAEITALRAQIAEARRVLSV